MHINCNADRPIEVAPRFRAPLLAKKLHLVEHVRANAWASKGGFAFGDGRPISGLTKSQCEDVCSRDSQCSCVVYCSKAHCDGSCWKRTRCSPEKFDKSASSTGMSVLVKQVRVSILRTASIPIAATLNHPSCLQEWSDPCPHCKYDESGEACNTKSQPFTGALPILQSAASSKEAHPGWHDYFEKVYHQPVPSATTVDLNTFEWFYWFAPGADSVVPLVANFWSGDRERFVGYPWRGE